MQSGFFLNLNVLEMITELNYCVVAVILLTLNLKQSSCIKVTDPPSKIESKSDHGTHGEGYYVLDVGYHGDEGKGEDEEIRYVTPESIGDETVGDSENHQEEPRAIEEGKFLFNLFNWNPTNKPSGINYIPIDNIAPVHTTFRPPTPMTRPPPGGYFSQHNYMPPYYQYPSEYIKPVYEFTVDSPPLIYQPFIVGANMHQIIGAIQTKPTPRPSTRPPFYPPNYSRPSYYKNGVIGSFIDLFTN